MTPPEMFYLEPGIDTSKLRIGYVFACVFCPEQTTNDGWVIIRFRVAMRESIHPSERGQFFRIVEQLSKEPITKAKAQKLYASVFEAEPA